MSELTGHFHTTAHGCKTYEVFYLQPSAIWTVAAWIQQKFGFQPTTLPVFGLDEIFLDLRKGRTQITLAWDNWSGLFVMARTRQGDPFIEQIGAYLESRLTELEEHRWYPPTRQDSTQQAD